MSNKGVPVNLDRKGRKEHIEYHERLEVTASELQGAGQFAQEQGDRAKEFSDNIETVMKDGPVQTVNGKTGQVTGLAEQSDLDEVDTRLSEKIDDKNQEVNQKINDNYDETSQQLAETMSISAPVASAFWNPPQQPSARSDENEYFESVFSVTSDKLINNHYEPMRSAFPDYIKRVNKGKDESGTYDWWRYEFTPKDYEKTLIIGSGIHGTEVGSVLGLYLFLKEVVFNWEDHPALSYLRHKVRLIVIPTINPWGLSQKYKRHNSNGVDLNRNFGYKWNYYAEKEPFDHDYKGTSEFSEVESRYIKETLEAYRDATSYIDFHNMITPRANYVVYFPKYLDSPKHLYTSLINQLRGQSSSQTIKWGEMDNPTSINYAANRFGMHSSNPEFGDGIWGRMYDSVEMTKYVEWIGNIVIQHSKLDLNASSFNRLEPFTIRGYYQHGIGSQLNIPYDTQNDYEELEDLRMEFDIPTEGILQVRGEIVVLGTSSVSDEAITFILPIAGQKIEGKGSSVDFDPFSKKVRMWEVYAQDAKRKTIPFSAEIPVYPTSIDIGKAIVGLYAHSTEGIVSVQRYRVSATFIPSQKGDRVRTFDATGNAGSGVGAMNKKFPEEKRGFDI